MHTERLENLAKWLDNGAKHETVTFSMNAGVAFNQVVDLDPQATIACGTICCIAGAAVQFFNDLPNMIDAAMKDSRDILDIRSDKELPWSDVRSEAMALLDIDEDIADQLFTPGRLGYFRPLTRFNDPKWAARVIRNLIVTGKVDWDGLEVV